MLLVSGGFLSESIISEQDALITHALGAGVVINSIDAKRLYTLDLEMPQGGDADSFRFQFKALDLAMTAGNDAIAGLA